uniref:Acyloxyacyl hydrolase n=1 Tax=Crocodylus porosus TaxID=8502 RepID=A0A7M4EVF7_CROPO
QQRSKLLCLNTCVDGCVLVTSVIEQLAQLHNSTAKAALERLCNYIPEKLHFQDICYLVAEIYGPELVKLLEYKMNADVVCHSIKLCKQDAGQPLCHLYPPPKFIYTEFFTVFLFLGGKKSFSIFFFYSVIKNQLPFEDFDGDKFSVFPTLRGYHWRGRDCNEGNATVYPGRRPHNWDVESDTNCNGIWGILIPLIKSFLLGTESKGIILLGDSAGAHFHIPPEWMTAAQMSLRVFSDLPLAFTNEFDWPQFSGITGFLNSTIGGWTDSFYLYLRRRNLCNHRDFQNISKNDHVLDNPAIVIYYAIGNDVCNGRPDTVAHMTTPKQMHSNVMEMLQYLDSHLPKGSHVILTGLVDGRFLWDQLHNRYHPLGQLNKDVTYKQLYSFLSCLRVSCPFSVDQIRALQLSNVLKEIARSEKFASFDIFYMDFPLKKIAEEWHNLGGEAWQLIEPVDGFHPSQVQKERGMRGELITIVCYERMTCSATEPLSRKSLILGVPMLSPPSATAHKGTPQCSASDPAGLGPTLPPTRWGMALPAWLGPLPPRCGAICPIPLPQAWHSSLGPTPAPPMPPQHQRWRGPASSSQESKWALSLKLRLSLPW